MQKINAYLTGLFLTLISSSVLAQDSGSSFFNTVGAIATVDGLFNDYLGWFASLIFTSVPIGGAGFPLLVGWELVAATIFTWYFGFVQLSPLFSVVPLPVRVWQAVSLVR
ncbi:MAG: hypothetical protein ACI810_001379 [Gammaproteobacteria bacterium]